MFGTIRKHQGWLWWIIIVVVVCSFVVFFAPSSNFNQDAARPSGQYFGAIDGRDITETEWRNAMNEAYLRHFIMQGRWPDRDSADSGFNPEEQTYQQLLLIRKLEQFNIEPDPVSVAQNADGLIRQFTRGRAMDVPAFVKEHLGGNVSADDFERFLRHDSAIRQLVSVIGLSGQLVTPEEARLVYERERRLRATQAVFFSATNYLDAVVVSSNALAEFYTNQIPQYRLNDRRQVSYVAFPATNFLAEAEKALTNLNQIVEANIQGTNYLEYGKTIEEAKKNFREKVIHLRALNVEARKQANEFAAALFEMEPQRPENLAQLARTNGLTVKTTAPFDAEEGPAEIRVRPDFTKAAFALSPANDPYRGNLIGEDAVYVIAFHKHIPSEVPSLESIRGRVVEDFKHYQAAMLARQAGSRFAQSLAGALEQGGAFAQVCATNKVKPITMPPLSVATPKLPEIEEHLTLPYYKQIAFSTSVGKVSNFAPTRDGGVVVYVEKELPIDPAAMQKDLPGFVNMLRQQREQEAFYDWFNKQADKSLHRPRRPNPAPPAVGRS